MSSTCDSFRRPVIGTETDRTDAETDRKDAETDRTDAETDRTDAETERADPEARLPTLSCNEIFLHYYKENDVFFSLEGILQLISIVLCIVICVVYITVAPCERGGGRAGAPALAAAAALALVVSARALHLPRSAPHLCLMVELTVCGGSGLVTLVWGALEFALCRRAAPARYFLAVCSVCVCALVTCSAWLTHAGATRGWDATPAPRDIAHHTDLHV